MKKTRIVMLPALLAAGMGLTGCGSSLGENSLQYIDAVASRLQSAAGGSSARTGKDTGTPLDAPADFTVDNEGNYSFSGVDNADYYIVYMYDAKAEAGASYLQIGNNISEDGSASYSGNLKDSMAYGYGDFRIEVVAYPSVTDETYRKSEASACEMLVTGSVAEPAYAYMWDYFSDTLSVELTSIGEYQYTAYPTKVEVVLTNEADPSDTVTMTLEDLTLINDQYILSTSDVTMDAVYDMEAHAVWDADIVSNASADTEIGSVETSSCRNAIFWGYGYCNTANYNFMDYPLVVDSFDLTKGGSIGKWYSYSPYSASGYGLQNAEYTATWQEDKSVYFTATPTEAEEGAAYTYRVDVAGENGGAIYREDFGSLGEMEGTITGTLNIYEDGTFKVQLDPREIIYIEVKGSALLFTGSEAEGAWTDNGDGTITMNYDLSTVTMLEE